MRTLSQKIDPKDIIKAQKTGNLEEIDRQSVIQQDLEKINKNPE